MSGATTVSVSNEAQARPLRPFRNDPDMLKVIWGEIERTAEEQGEPVTESLVRRTRDKIVRKKRPPKPPKPEPDWREEVAEGCGGTAPAAELFYDALSALRALVEERGGELEPDERELIGDRLAALAADVKRALFAAIEGEAKS